MVGIDSVYTWAKMIGIDPVYIRVQNGRHTSNFHSNTNK